MGRSTLARARIPVGKNCLRIGGLTYVGDTHMSLTRWRRDTAEVDVATRRVADAAAEPVDLGAAIRRAIAAHANGRTVPLPSAGELAAALDRRWATAPAGKRVP
jgi:hypothetical protein